MYFVLNASMGIQQLRSLHLLYANVDGARVQPLHHQFHERSVTPTPPPTLLHSRKHQPLRVPIASQDATVIQNVFATYKRNFHVRTVSTNGDCWIPLFSLWIATGSASQLQIGYCAPRWTSSRDGWRWRRQHEQQR